MDDNATRHASQFGRAEFKGPRSHPASDPPVRTASESIMDTSYKHCTPHGVNICVMKGSL